jgi:hypothetical protein
MDSIDGAISTALAAKSAATQQQIAIALLAKSQQATKQQGDVVVALLQAAAQLSKAPGKGENFDAVG